ncbi:hypothetical protein D9M70_498720 [compost metagenome]
MVSQRPGLELFIEEGFEGRHTGALPALDDGQRVAVLVGLRKVLDRLLACLIERQDTHTAQGAFLPPGPAHDVGFVTGSRDTDEQAGNGGIVDFVGLARCFQAVEQGDCQLRFHGCRWCRGCMVGAKSTIPARIFGLNQTINY